VSAAAAERLVQMANQIAREFAAQEPDAPARATATHLRRYWDPRMRATIVDELAAGGSGLTEVAREAVRILADGS